jgi:hypothetical protein
MVGTMVLDFSEVMVVCEDFLWELRGGMEEVEDQISVFCGV